MKTKFLMICLLVTALLLPGCYSSAAVVNSPVRGEGQMTLHEFPVSEYTQVEINGGVELIYSADSRKSVGIEIQENLAEYLIVSSEDDQLEITFTRPFTLDPGYTPKVYLYNANLHVLTVRGAVSIEEADPISAESFEMVISGAGSAELELDVDSLTMRVSGAGDLNLSGRADSAEIRISGAGSMDAAALQTKNASIQISGAGHGSISCSDYLEAKISGAGDLEYLGDPEVSKTITGGGSVRRIG